ncbi:hypothetical protein M422DRAFT_268074 [Sphaerobolus stellatus SS14]|uniref:Terpene synthase n=1 Tax=Sphaerobolus stellatus (strain SS14) TaxID=990650 RepID=A0A0C9U7U5_SPHS4|nr:hypothetical protein M422DRAFT_268074 [Sphaerobolus stellatus SS14]
MSKTIALPKLLAGWPYQPSISPHHEEVARECKVWIGGFQPLSPKSPARFDRCNFPLMTALAYPEVSREHLRLTADFMMWFFLYDEITDVKTGTNAIILSYIDFFRRYPTTVLLESDPILVQKNQDLWLRTLAFSVSSSANRLLSGLEQFILAVCEEAEDREIKRVRNIKEYLGLRRGTVAADAVFFLGLLHIDIPETMMSHPMVQQLTLLYGDLICIHNDIFSYNIEQARGIHGDNLVTAVMKEKGLGVQGAISYSGTLVQQAVLEFMENLSQVSILFAGEEGLNVHIGCMLNWIVAMDEWSFLTPCYFGEARFQNITALLSVQILTVNQNANALEHNSDWKRVVCSASARQRGVDTRVNKEGVCLPDFRAVREAHDDAGEVDVVFVESMAMISGLGKGDESRGSEKDVENISILPAALLSPHLALQPAYSMTRLPHHLITFRLRGSSLWFSGTISPATYFAECDSNNLENAIISEKAREWLSIPAEYPLQPLSLLISKPTHLQPHHYPSSSLKDLSEEELSLTLDPVSQEALRHLIQSEASNNALKVALVRRDYASLTSFMLGQLRRYQMVLAQAEILRAAHYERLKEDDHKQKEFLVEAFGEEDENKLALSDSAAFEEELDKALISMDLMVASVCIFILIVTDNSSLV